MAMNHRCRYPYNGRIIQSSASENISFTSAAPLFEAMDKTFKEALASVNHSIEGVG
jgi:hypothetical protein